MVALSGLVALCGEEFQPDGFQADGFQAEESEPAAIPAISPPIAMPTFHAIADSV